MRVRGEKSPKSISSRDIRRECSRSAQNLGEGRGGGEGRGEDKGRGGGEKRRREEKGRREGRRSEGEKRRENWFHVYCQSV